MFFVSFLLVCLAIHFSDAKLVVTGNCNFIKFHNIFTPPPMTKAYGQIFDSPSETLPHQTVILFPNYLTNFNSPASLLIYKERDSKFISNLPKDVSDVESWDDSFGICTEVDIDLGKCDNVGEFKLELKDQSLKEKIVNRLFHFEENEDGRLKKIYIELELGNFCFITAFEDATEDEDKKPDKSQESLKISKTFKKNGVLLGIVHNKWEETNVFLDYYGHMIFSAVQFFLGIFIWTKIKLDKRKITKGNSSALATPYRCCFAIVIVSFVSSILHMTYMTIYMTYSRKRLVLEDRSDIFNKGSFTSLVLTILRRSDDILETLDDILIYLFCFQFVNLDDFGMKINFKKNKFGSLFIGVLFWTLIVHPFIIDYRYELLYTVRESFDIKNHEYIINILRTIVRESYEAFNLLNYIIIWYILYKTSQETENNFLANENKLKEYTKRFKFMRIWLVFSAIVLKFVGFILSHFIFKFVRKFTEYILLEIEENSYRGGSELIFSNIVLTFLKGFLSILRTFDIFAFPILIIITLRIWWNYDEVKFEEIEMDNLLS